MNAEIAIDSFATMLVLGIGVPLGLCCVLGFVLSFFQALFQIQDQILSFFPKILCLSILFYFCLPIFFEQLSMLFRDILEGLQYV